MEFIVGAGIFMVGLLIGYSIKDDDSAERIEALEDDMDGLQQRFVPAVTRSIESIAGDIKQLSENDGALIDAYQSVSGRIATWVTDNEAQD